MLHHLLRAGLAKLNEGSLGKNLRQSGAKVNSPTSKLEAVFITRFKKFLTDSHPFVEYRLQFLELNFFHRNPAFLPKFLTRKITTSPS